MGEVFDHIRSKDRDFIRAQKIFFIATAAANGHINLSPRNADFLKVIDDSTIIFADRTGSGNETAAHILADGRVTMMFCAFEGAPAILRLYGQGEVLHRQSSEFSRYKALIFDGQLPPGVRQMILLKVEKLTTACGYSVPFYDYLGERKALDNWAHKKGEAGLKSYWHDNNQLSMDGLPTAILSSED